MPGQKIHRRPDPEYDGVHQVAGCGTAAAVAGWTSAANYCSEDLTDLTEELEILATEVCAETSPAVREAQARAMPQEFSAACTRVGTPRRAVIARGVSLS